jgi:hypothetical protein
MGASNSLFVTTLKLFTDFFMTTVLLDAVVYRSADSSVGIKQAGSGAFKSLWCWDYWIISVVHCIESYLIQLMNQLHKLNCDAY